MNIIVTGGGGYIGSHVTKAFLKQGYAVTVFDNFSTGYQEPLKILKKYGKVTVVKGDLRKKRDLEKLLKNTNSVAIAHLAAACSVDESVKNPKKYFQNNTVGTQNLLQAMKKYKHNNLIFSSTCAVYGETKKLPVSEKHPTKPVNPYGASKLQAEKLIKESGINSVIFRYFNVCGASSVGEIGDSKKPSLLLMQNAVRGAMGIEKFYFTFPKVKTKDSSPIRDYLNVEDLADAHLLALKYLQSHKGTEIFNLGTGSGYSVKEIVSQVEKIVGVKMEKTATETRQGEYAEIYADASKAKRSMGFKNKRSLKDSITSLKKWYKGHPYGYKY